MQIALLSLDDLAATQRLGLFLANHMQAGDIVALEGGLGAGKSELARAIIRHLCPDEDDIPSPTFTLVQTYEPETLPQLLHFDLYRLETPEDAFALGIEDAFVDSICLIEWPERLGPYLPATALKVSLAMTDGGESQRRVTIDGPESWQARLSGLITI